MIFKISIKVDLSFTMNANYAIKRVIQKKTVINTIIVYRIIKDLNLAQNSSETSEN